MKKEVPQQTLCKSFLIEKLQLSSLIFIFWWIMSGATWKFAWRKNSLIIVSAQSYSQRPKQTFNSWTQKAFVAYICNSKKIHNGNHAFHWWAALVGLKGASASKIIESSSLNFSVKLPLQFQTQPTAVSPA